MSGGSRAVDGLRARTGAARSPAEISHRAPLAGVPAAGLLLARLQRQLGNQAVVALLRNHRRDRSAPGRPLIGFEGGELDQETESTLRRASSGGTPLDATTRSTFEGAFGGADFSDVRLHRSHQAAELSSRLQAKAFTVGRHIYFGEGA